MRVTVRPSRELVALMVVAASQRSALTSVPPQINAIRTDLNLSLSQFAILTAIPLISFGVAAPIGISAVARRKPVESTILFSITTLVIALLLRASFNSSTLFLGTILTSVAIAALNVLVPFVIKRDFPNQITSIMPFYTVVLAVFATLGALLSVPFSNLTTQNWRGGLLIWVVIPICAFVLWLPIARKHSNNNTGTSSTPTPWKPVLRDPLSWFVMLFMGIQSTTFYCTVAWLPKIFIDWGESSATAGSLLALTTAISIPCSLFIPMWLGRGADQRKAMVVVTIAAFIGFLGLAFAHSTFTWLWLLLLGIGQSSFPTALVIISLRARSNSEAAPLSAMSQGLGYLIAASGPIIIGQLHQINNRWTLPFIFLASLCVIQFFVGWKAAQAREEEL